MSLLQKTNWRWRQSLQIRYCCFCRREWEGEKNKIWKTSPRALLWGMQVFSEAHGLGSQILKLFQSGQGRNDGFKPPSLPSIGDFSVRNDKKVQEFIYTPPSCHYLVALMQRFRLHAFFLSSSLGATPPKTLKGGRRLRCVGQLSLPLSLAIVVVVPRWWGIPSKGINTPFLCRSLVALTIELRKRENSVDREPHLMNHAPLPLSPSTNELWKEALPPRPLSPLYLQTASSKG